MPSILKDGEYYWLSAPAINENEPIMIGRFYTGTNDKGKWFINGQRYTAGIGINAIRRIVKPAVWLNYSLE